MKRSLVNLIASAVLLGVELLTPHSQFNVTLETPAPPPAQVAPQSTPQSAPQSAPPYAAAQAAGVPISVPAATEIPTVTEIPATEQDPYGELYFTLVGFTQPPRLMRLQGECVVKAYTCPQAEEVQTPFEMKDVFTTFPRGLTWTRDGKLGALVTHPEDDLSRGWTQEELSLVQTQLPEQFHVSDSTIYLLEAETGAWRELYRLERKFIYSPVWSADGQWLAFAVRSSLLAFHPIQADDGIYVIHADGSGLKQLAPVDAVPLGWIGSSVAIQRNLSPYPAVSYSIEMLSLDGQVTSLFSSSRVAYYNLAPDGGAFLVTDAQGENPGGPQKLADLVALDGSTTHSFGAFDNTTQSIWVTAWSSDSTQIAFGNLRRFYVAPRNGEPREVYIADDTFTQPSFWNAAFSPDQKVLLLDVYDGMTKVVVVSLENGQTTELTWEGMDPDEQVTNLSWRP